MKTSSMIAAFALAAVAGLAHAQGGEATYELPLPAVSENTRAQVRAELLGARQNIVVTEFDRQAWDPVNATRSRDVVQAEAAAAIASGYAAAVTSEAGLSQQLPRGAVLRGHPVMAAAR